MSFIEVIPQNVHFMAFFIAGLNQDGHFCIHAFLSIIMSIYIAASVCIQSIPKVAMAGQEYKSSGIGGAYLGDEARPRT